MVKKSQSGDCGCGCGGSGKCGIRKRKCSKIIDDRYENDDVLEFENNPYLEDGYEGGSCKNKKKMAKRRSRGRKSAGRKCGGKTYRAHVKEYFRTHSGKATTLMRAAAAAWRSRGCKRRSSGGVTKRRRRRRY